MSGGVICNKTHLTDKRKVQAYVDTQMSPHHYPEEAHWAFVDVLSALPEEYIEEVTQDIILTVLHEGAIALAMHFEPIPERFRVLHHTTRRAARSAALGHCA